MGANYQCSLNLVTFQIFGLVGPPKEIILHLSSIYSLVVINQHVIQQPSLAKILLYSVRPVLRGIPLENLLAKNVS